MLVSSVTANLLFFGVFALVIAWTQHPSGGKKAEPTSKRSPGDPGADFFHTLQRGHRSIYLTSLYGGAALLLSGLLFYLSEA